MHRFLAILVSILLFTGSVSAQYTAVLFNGSGLSYHDKLAVLTIAGIVNRDTARLYLLNVYETWSYDKTDEVWRDLYRAKGNVSFDSIVGITNLIERFRPFIHGAVTYDPSKTYGNFVGQSFLWQGEFAALIGGLTSRIPASPNFAAAHQLAVTDSLYLTDGFDRDSARWITARLDDSSKVWNTPSWSAEKQYLALLQYGIQHVLPVCHPSKLYIREITDFTIQQKMFQVNIAGTDDLKLDSLSSSKADILEAVLEYLHSRNPASIFHIYGWIRPEPMTQWFAYYGASFHETLLSNLSWHSSFPMPSREYITPSRHEIDSLPVEDKYYLLFIGSEGDASNWQFSFQSGAWLSPKRGTIPITWGWNLHLFEQCPFVAGYYYDTATPHDGFISVTSPLGYAYPDLWQNDIWNFAINESKRLLTKFGIRTVYGYKHYEGKGMATFRGKTISNSFHFLRYGQFQKAIGADMTFLYDPLLPLQTPVTQYGSVLYNHCDDGSFYGNAVNLSVMATRILNQLKQQSAPSFLLAGYQRFRQDDFGVRIDPGAADISISRLEQLITLMKYDSTIGRKIEVVTVDKFQALLRKKYSITKSQQHQSGPSDFLLEQNYPNPFNPTTTIRFHMPEPDVVQLTIFDVLGRVVGFPLKNETYEAGVHFVQCNPYQFGLSSGVYYYRLSAGKYTAIKKMIFIQ